jgi:hypothetical protein
MKLNECLIMPDALELVGILLLKEGNTHAHSKSLTYEVLVQPATYSDLLSIKGLFSWYSRLIDWFEVHTTA